MKILVIGSTGFIGKAITKRLLSKFKDVSVLLRQPENELSSLKAKILIGDLKDFKSLKIATKGMDVVINSAAVLPHRKQEKSQLWKVNALGVKKLIFACQQNKVKRLIHLSTVGIYGPTLNHEVGEGSNPHPIDDYTKSKLAAEKFILRSRFKSKTVIIRPTIAYGPGDRRPVFLRLFKMISSRICILIGSGNNYLHTVYIDNLVDVIIKSVTLKNVLGQDFNVGDLKCPTMNNIVDLIIKSLNNKCVKINIPFKIALFASKILGIERTVRFVSENRKYSTKKFEKYFNVKSDISIDRGLISTFNWYKQNKLI